MLVYYQNLHDFLLILVILGNSRHIGWIEEQKKNSKYYCWAYEFMLGLRLKLTII